MSAQLTLRGGQVVNADPVTDLADYEVPASSPGGLQLAGPRAAVARPRGTVSLRPVIQLPPPPGQVGRIVRLANGQMAVTPSSLVKPGGPAPFTPPVPQTDPPPGQPIIQGLPDGSLCVAPLPAAFAGDDAQQINAAILQAGGAQGYGGLVRLGPWAYVINSTIVLPPQMTGTAFSTNAGYNRGQGPVSLHGIYGATVLNLGPACFTAIYCHRSDWWNPQQNSQPNPMLLGSSIRDIMIDATNNTAGGVIGIDMGDMWGGQVTGVLIRNFYSAAGTSIGFYKVNRLEWSEKWFIQLHTINCDNHVVVDMVGAVNGQVSHEYCDWDLYMYMLGASGTLSGNGQNGMTWLNGAFQGSGMIRIRGNHGGGGAGTPGYVIKFGGGANDGLNGNWAQAYNVEWDVVVESNAASNGPMLLVLNGANNQMKGHGQVVAQFGGWVNSVLNGGTFAVSGRVNNDPGLLAVPTLTVAASGSHFTYSGIDIALYLTGLGGATITNVKINGNSIGWNPAAPCLLGYLTDGCTVQFNYSGGTPLIAGLPISN